MESRHLTNEQLSMTLGQLQKEKNDMVEEIRAKIKEFTARTGVCIELHCYTHCDMVSDSETGLTETKLIGVVDATTINDII